MELGAGLDAAEKGVLAAVLEMLAGVEVEGAVGAGEGRGEDMPALRSNVA